MFKVVTMCLLFDTTYFLYVYHSFAKFAVGRLALDRLAFSRLAFGIHASGRPAFGRLIILIIIQIISLFDTIRYYPPKVCI